MSIETWEAEFYPTEANSAEAHERAIDHSLQKWTGLRPENLARHGLVQVGYELHDENSIDKVHPLFKIDAGTCALCSLHFDISASCEEEDSPMYTDTPECMECPLFKVRSHVACDHCLDGELQSPYGQGTYGPAITPEPMIRWLLKAKEQQA